MQFQNSIHQSGYTLAVRILLISGFLLAVTGCKQNNSIVGSWKSDTGMGASMTLEFAEDKSFKMTPEGIGGGVQLQGTYTYIENRLKLKFDGVKLPGNDPFSGMAESLMSNRIPEDANLTIAWKTQDEIILDGQGFLKGRFKRESSQ